MRLEICVWEKRQNKSPGAKAAHKMLVKLNPGDQGHEPLNQGYDFGPSQGRKLLLISEMALS